MTRSPTLKLWEGVGDLNLDLCLYDETAEDLRWASCLSSITVSSTSRGSFDRSFRLNMISLGENPLKRIRELTLRTTNARSVGVIGPDELFNRKISYCIS